MTHRISAPCGVAILAITGCAGPLPQYAWSNATTAWETMTRRDRTIQTFSATCRLLLKGGEGNIELTGVIVARPPDHLRVRAWKFSHVVFDVTMNPSGVFVFSQNREKRGAQAALPITRQGMIEVAAMLPGFLRHANWRIATVPETNRFALERTPGAQHARMTCTVDPRTLTTQTCHDRDRTGEGQPSVVFEGYRMIDEVPWPMRVEGIGEGASFTLMFDNVAINAELAPNAFQPPRRATKQP